MTKFAANFAFIIHYSLFDIPPVSPTFAVRNFGPFTNHGCGGLWGKLLVAGYWLPVSRSWIICGAKSNLEPVIRNKKRFYETYISTT
jgi:hypothetical protein